MQALSDEWKNLDDVTKRQYPVLGSSDERPKPGDFIAEPFERNQRKRRQLWKNMKQQVCGLEFMANVSATCLIWRGLLVCYFMSTSVIHTELHQYIGLVAETKRVIPTPWQSMMHF